MTHRQIDARVISTRTGVILTQSGGGERNEEAMKHYTLSIAAEKLGIDHVTLWR